MQAIILAGGGGERLRPLTTTVPKPLLPVANQPVMERLIENLARAGFDEVLLTTYHLAPHIAAWLQTWTPPIPVRTLQEPRPLGTAGCVRHALPFLRDEFMVAPGDVVAECDFRAFVAWHRAQQADVSLLAIRVPDTREFGILETDVAGRITRFQEKPAPHEAFSNLANAGFYLMHKRAFELVPEDTPFDFSRGLFPRLMDVGARFKAWEAGGYWADIGTPASYLAANTHLLHAQGTVAGAASIAGDAELHLPYLVGADCSIAAGAVIGPDTVLGRGCSIGEGAQVRGSVLHADIQVGAGAILDQCAVGAGARIGAGATIGECCVIGAGCGVPAGATLAPHTRYEGEADARGLQEVSGEKKATVTPAAHPTVEPSATVPQTPPSGSTTLGTNAAEESSAQNNAQSDKTPPLAAWSAPLNGGARAPGCYVASPS